ncbi:MAG: hypothetical protein Q7J36_11880 [Thiobacillus sp.]|nr:hypothetical protein [Thiobacillus sp.]
MTYSTASTDYLDRMKALLDEGSEASLFYAALELRCGVEARLREYIETIDHIPKAQKKEWAVAKLGRSIESAYRSGDKIMIFTIIFPEDGAQLQLMYVPVSKRLQDIANRLGDYLHVPKSDVAENQAWWKQLKELLTEAYPLLKLATSGELIGLPLIHHPTNRLNARVLISGDDPRHALLPRITQGAQHTLKVEYIEPIPGSFTFYES